MPFTGCADDSQNTSVSVIQQNTNYVQWSQTTPNHYGNILSGSNMYPVSLISTGSNLGVLHGDTLGPSSVDVYISNPEIANGAIIYCAIGNAYGAFIGTSTLDNIFTWNDSIPGYTFRGTVSSTFGYINPNPYITVTSPSDISVAATQVRTGTNLVGRTISTENVSVRTLKLNVPQTSGMGTTYTEPYYITGSNQMAVVKAVTTPATELGTYNTIRFHYDQVDLCTCTTSANTSSTFLHSAIFVPVALVIPNNGFDDSVIADLDSIVSNLADMTSDIDSISVDVNAIASYLYDGDASVISALADVVEMLTFIRNGMVPVTAVSGHRWNSAIQYIEYYLSQVLYYDTHIASDTATIVNQLNDITSTLTQIASTIQDANDKADNINDTSEDIHEQEEAIFDDANDAIGSTVIESFSFDANTSAGLGRVGIDFNNLWMSLGSWAQVYVFSMTLTLALTIIRFSSARARAKEQSEYRRAQKEYYESHKRKGG